MTLSPLDLGLVLLYLAGTTLLGAWFTGRQRGVQTYFVGDRNVSWPLVLVSIVATETSTVTFLSIPGVAFNRDGGNMTFLQLALGYIVGRVVVAWLLLPLYFRGECFTAYQVLRQVFDPSVQKTASGLFLFTRTVADGLRLFLTALLLDHFTGLHEWLPGSSLMVSILIMGAATIVYTYLGGMQAVIWTDLIQFVIYIAGAVISGAILVSLLPEGWATLVQEGNRAGKFQVFDFRPDLSIAYGFWAGLLGGAFFSMASHGADQLMVQRYLCARSLGQARTALLLSGLLVFAQFTLFLLLGVGLFALHQNGGLPVPEGAKNDDVFGLFIVRYLPVGVKGLVVAAVLAAAMSTLSSSLNSSATASLTDFYRPLRPERDNAHYLRVSRRLTFFWGLAQVGVALGAVWLNSPEAIVNRVLAVAGFTTGIILGLFLLARLPWRVASSAALAGMLAGFAAVLGLWLWSLLEPAGQPRRAPAWPWYAPVGALTTVSVALVLQSFRGFHGSSADRGAEPRLP